MHRLLTAAALLFTASLLSGCFVGRGYYPTYGQYNYGYRYRVVPSYYQQPPQPQYVYAPPAQYVAPPSYGYAAPSTAVVANGSSINLPAELPLNLIQGILVQSDDGRQFTLSATDIRSLGNGSSQLNLPPGVSSGTAIFYVAGRGIPVRFRMSIGGVVPPVQSSPTVVVPAAPWASPPQSTTVTVPTTVY